MKQDKYNWEEWEKKIRNWLWNDCGKNKSYQDAVVNDVKNLISNERKRIIDSLPETITKQYKEIENYPDYLGKFSKDKIYQVAFLRGTYCGRKRYLQEVKKIIGG